MDHSQAESVIAKKELEKFYETIYPFKSEFELWYQYKSYLFSTEISVDFK